jgi:CRP/FNR family transcriptional regulator/CRP/FNR family nitrogen fixation transcriptional regulator
VRLETDFPRFASQPVSIDAAPTTSLLAGCLELIGSPFSYGREEEIYGEGEEAEYVYRVVAGAVRTTKVLADGRRQIHAFHLPGDNFGFEPGKSHRLNAEAIADTHVLLFRRRQIETVANRNVEAACRLWDMSMRSLEQAEEHALLLGRRTALERVASFLMNMETRLGVNGAIDLPMSRRDIADYLGLTLETVSRCMSQLRSDRAMTLSSARKVLLNKGKVGRVCED